MRSSDLWGKSTFKPRVIKNQSFNFNCKTYWILQVFVRVDDFARRCQNSFEGTFSVTDSIQSLNQAACNFGDGMGWGWKKVTPLNGFEINLSS